MLGTSASAVQALFHLRQLGFVLLDLGVDATHALDQGLTGRLVAGAADLAGKGIALRAARPPG